MVLSYAITVCNEEKEIKDLLTLLFENKRVEDEICILLDKPKASGPLLDYLYSLSSSDKILLKESYFAGNFSEWKNQLHGMCTGDYIFNIDADEIPHQFLLQSLPEILEVNDVDLIRVPRINTVEGITQEHIKKWRWKVSEEGYINFPDFQGRIYKNSKHIKWTGKVHEYITGFKTEAILPTLEEFCLYHHKGIRRQENQNELYNRI